MSIPIASIPTGHNKKIFGNGLTDSKVKKSCMCSTIASEYMKGFAFCSVLCMQVYVITFKAEELALKCKICSWGLGKEYCGSTWTGTIVEVLGT